MRESRIPAIAMAGVIIVAVATDAVASSNDFIALRAACQVLLDQPLEKRASETVLNTARDATNSQLRCRAIAICTLAAILRDDPVEYKLCLTAPDSSFPPSSLTLRATPADFSDECPVCEGSGKGTRSCTACNGKGTCGGCRGSGQVTRPDFDGPYLAKCFTCKGSGRCNYCQGEGKFQTTCHNCGGRGQVLSKSRARTAYLRSVEETSDFCYLLLHPEITRVKEAVETAKKQGDVTAALAVLQKVIQLYPEADNITSAKDMLALLQEQQRTQEGAEDFQKKAEQEAKDRLLAHQRQQLKEARESNDVHTAIDSVQLFIKSYPASPYILEAKSLLRELQAKKELIDSTGL